MLATILNSFLLLSFLLLGLADGKKANEAYEKGDYAQAEQLYREALAEEPEDLRLLFNLASSVAQQEGRAEEAISLFEQFKSASSNPQERAKADYNIGRLLADAQQWDQASNAFQNALMQDPADTEAKHNYELAQQMQKNQEQEQQQDQNQDQNQDQQDQQDQQQQNQQNQDQQQDQNQDQQNQQNQDQQQQDQQQNQQQQQAQEPQISKEEARKMLEALDKKEKDLLKQFKKKQTKPKEKNAKDW